MKFMNFFLGKGPDRSERKVQHESPLAVIQYYKNLGFFEGQDSNIVESEYLESNVINANAWGFEEKVKKPTDILNKWYDAYILTSSHSGVLFSPLDGQYYEPGKGYFVKLLKDLGEISRGAFTPEDISEELLGIEGPVKIGFTLVGKNYSVVAKYNLFSDGMLDFWFLCQINMLLAGMGVQFELVETPDLIVVLFISNEQKRKMIEEQSFPFAW